MPTSSASAEPAAIRPLWKDMVTLTKPRILMSNLFAAFGGYWLASQWDVDWMRLLYTLIGTTLVMASACVFNNYLDRDLDMKMERTRLRALPTKRLNPGFVFSYGILLGLAGLAVLLYVSVLCAVLGLAGMFVYVIVYTRWLKRSSTWSTSVGGISGSMPPVIGYCAVSNEIDAGAWLLFLILFLWQPPHFWALGIRRKEEYRAAGFPLLPVVKGVLRTKLQMLPYIVLLIISTVLMYTYNYVGIYYLIISVVLGVIWLAIAVYGLVAKDDEVWSKRAFKFSVNYLMVTFLVMIVDTVRI